MLCQDGVATPEAVAFARERTRAAGVSFVQGLAEAPGVDAERLAEWIASRTGTLLMSLQEGELDTAAVGSLPPGIARAHCCVPVSLESHEGQSRIRVALANPANRAAIDAIERATGCGVVAVTASVNEIQRALEKYAGSASEPPPALLSEPTRRVSTAAPTPEGLQVGTTPSHRLSQGAPLELKVEALVLALVGRGVITRAEYEDALKRLLKRSHDS